MKILIVSATSQEIEPFICAHAEFTYSHHFEIDILITGVGCINTVYHLQKKLQEKKYDLAIQAGIAGSFIESGIKLGEVKLVPKDTFGDMGAEALNKFTTLFEMGLADKDEFPFINGWLHTNYDHLHHISLQHATSITVNKLSDKKVQAKQLIEKFNAEIESMEGAAFNFVCLQENIPFIQIRSISNYVGERDKSKWKMKEAINNLNDKLLEIVDRIIVYGPWSNIQPY